MSPIDPMLTCDGCGASVLLRTAVIFHKDVAGIPISGRRGRPIDHFVGLCLACVTRDGDTLQAEGYDAISTRRFVAWPVS